MQNLLYSIWDLMQFMVKDAERADTSHCFITRCLWAYSMLAVLHKVVKDFKDGCWNANATVKSKLKTQSAHV